MYPYTGLKLKTIWIWVLEWIKVFVVINCVSVSIVPVITVANRWRMFHRNKVRIQHFTLSGISSIKGGAERSNLKFEMFWPLIVIKLSLLCGAKWAKRVKLHGAPGLAETMLMTQNRFKLYNSPTVKTLPWVQPELQPIYRIYFWKQQEWRLEDSDHILGWSHLILVCLFLKTGRSLLKVFPNRRKPTLKNFLPIF